jgi:hypothetical protein
LLLLLVVPLASSALARDLSIQEFFGVYVGRARVLDSQGKLVGERDLDFSIEPAKLGGFSVHWISVELVNGRRDVPGVERRVLDSDFQAPDNGFYAEDTRRTLFARRKDPDLMAGDTLRWARVHGTVLSVYAVAIADDGGYEVQVYNRTRTEDGLEIDFRRIVNDVVELVVEGQAIRVGSAPGSAD